jgi:hypothetical protein
MVCHIHCGGRWLMSSNFTQAQRDFLNNVKQSIALIHREIQRIREQRIAICMSGFELDWQLISVGATQGVAGANKIGSILHAHTDFQAALTELHGTQSQVPVSNSQNLPKASANSGDPSSLILGTGTRERHPALDDQRWGARTRQLHDLVLFPLALADREVS